jgi:hypothetical protein
MDPVLDPASPVAKMVARLRRPDRRLFLAALRSARTPRRTRLQRKFERRVFPINPAV